MREFLTRLLRLLLARIGAFPLVRLGSQARVGGVLRRRWGDLGLNGSDAASIGTTSMGPNPLCGAPLLVFKLPQSLFIELFQVTLQDQFLVHALPLGLIKVHGGVIECEKPATDRGIVHPKGASGVELRIKAVLGRRFQGFHAQLLVVFVLEPFVGNLPVPEVLVRKRPAVDDGCDAVLLEHLAAKPSATRPGVHI